MIVRRLVLAAVCLTVAFMPAGASGTARQMTVYGLRGDPRMCPSPMCGGFWASRVNWKVTTCLGGAARPACYAASVDLSALSAAAQSHARPALSSWRALAEGTFARYSNEFPQLARLVASHVWLAAGPRRETSTVYRVVDTGLRCIRAPCFSLRATVVNGTRTLTLSNLDLAGAGAAPATINRANTALAHSGVLVSGTIRTLASTGIAGPWRTFAATQLWLAA
jgi:hypothetical protein